MADGDPYAQCRPLLQIRRYSLLRGALRDVVFVQESSVTNRYGSRELRHKQSLVSQVMRRVWRVIRGAILGVLALALLLPPLYNLVIPEQRGALAEMPMPSPGSYQVFVADWGYHTSIVVEQPRDWTLGPPRKERAPLLRGLSRRVVSSAAIPLLVELERTFRRTSVGTRSTHTPSGQTTAADSIHPTATTSGHTIATGGRSRVSRPRSSRVREPECCSPDR
jgi:hypothetical protein